MKVTRLGKKQGVPSSDVLEYIKYLDNVPEAELAGALEQIDKWRWNRHDLLHWVSVLDRLDAILERVITEFELDRKLQVKDFDERIRRLILAIIHFQFLLLDSCVNKRAFASYDRFYHLLLTNDLEILRRVIYCTYRSTQQYLNRTPFEAGMLPKFAERLLALSKGWERLLGSGLSLVEIMTATEYTPPSDPVLVTFYPDKAQAGSSKSPDTSITVDLSTIDPAYSAQQLSQIAEEKHMPLNDQLLALTKLRLGHMKDLKTRQYMLSIRCLAYSVYDEEVVEANVFLYEPDFVKHLAEVTEAKTDDFTRAAALLALDASFRMKTQTAEVVQAMSFGVSHGPLFNLLRTIGTDSELPDFFVDALFNFMGTIVRDEGYVTLLIGAGALTVLLEALNMEGPDRTSHIPRICGLLEALTYVPMQGLTLLSNADGVNTYVRKIREELAREPPPDPDTEPIAFDHESLAQYNWGPLRALLRQVFRLMHNTGGFEGLRNLVDTDLPMSIKTIFENPDKYGIKAYHIAISTMTAFIHNEPTWLAILQEQGLPQALYKPLLDDCPKSFEVICAIPSAIGAICLNNDGLDLTKSNLKVLRNAIQAALDVDGRDDFGKESMNNLGALLDELVRHHPTLRQGILDLMMEMVDEAIEEGIKAEPTEEKRAQCDLFQIAAKPDLKEDLPPVLLKTGKLCGLLAAMLHVPAVAAAFIENRGVEKLLRICDCQTVPLTFAPSPVTPLGTIFKALGDKERVGVASQFAASLDKVLDSCAGLWDKEAGHDVVAAWLAIRDKKDHLIETQRTVRAFLSIGYRLEFLSVVFTLQGSRDWDGFVTIVSGLRDTHGCLDRIGRFYLNIFDTISHLKHWDYTTAPPTTFSNPANFTIERVCIATNKFNQGLLAMMDNKRTILPAQRTEVDRLATHMAKLLAALISTATGSEREVPIARLATVLVQAHSMLLEGPGLGTVGAVMVIAAFIQQGHMPALVEVFSRILDFYDKMPADVLASIKDEKGEKKHLEGAIYSLLLVLAALVSSRTHLYSPWAAHLAKTEPTFSIHKLILRLRHAIFPVLHRIWMSPWLTELGANAIKTELYGYKAVMEAKDEVEPPRTQPVIQQQSVARTAEAILNQIAPALSIPAVVVPNPARVAMLVEMGFSQGAAERALIRARNSVTNATEMLITEPHLFADAEPAAPAPAAAADPAVAATSAEASTDAASAAVDSAQTVTDSSNPAEQSSTIGHTATDETAVENPAPASARMETDDPPQPDQSEYAVELKDDPEHDYLKELNSQREEAKSTLSERTVEIVDRNSDLATSLCQVLDSAEFAVSYLLDKLSEATEDYDDSRESLVHARLRFLAVVMGNLKSGLDDMAVAKALTVLSCLDMSRSPRPKWLSGAMLLSQAVLLSPPLVTPAKIGDEPSSIISETSSFEELEQQYFDACISIISAGTSENEAELASAYRGLVLLTRRSDRAFSFIKSMIDTFRSAESRAEGLQCFLAMIFRHAFEDERTVSDIMRREIGNLKPLNDLAKVIELKDFVDSTQPLAMRDPARFIETVEAGFSLILPKTQSGRYQLKPKAESSEKKTEKDGNTASGAAEGDVAMSDPFRETPMNPSAKAIIELLLAELKSMLSAEDATPAPNKPNKVEVVPSVAEEKKEREQGTAGEDAEKAKAEEVAKAEAKAAHTHSYLSLILGLLTELVGSYMPAKQIFLTACRAPGTFGPGKAGIMGLITGLGCSANLAELSTSTKSRSVEVKRTIDIQHWAQSLVVAVCADLSPLRDMKDIHEDLVSVRKTVIDAIVKGIRDGYSISTLDARYSRLWQLADLIHQLLPINTRPPLFKDESRTHMARIMIEKNCVSALTAAIGDADLNYPNVGGAGIAVLRALDDLTKIATKWGKIDKNKSASSMEAPQDASSTRPEIDEAESDMEMDDEDEDDENDEDGEMPDLYQGSTLQRLENEPVDEDEDEMDDDDDEMYDGVEYDGEGYDDGLIDYDHMDALEETDPSGDEDDEDEDMDEGDWTDDEGDEEDEDDGSENPDDIHPEIVIGDDASYDVDGLDWDGPPPTSEDMRRIFEHDLDMQDQDDDEEGDSWDEGGDHDDLFDGYDDIDLDEEDYDREDDLEDPGFGYEEQRETNRANSGPWGWYGASNSRGSASSRAYDEASAYFGFGDPSESRQGTVPTHPLVRTHARPANISNGLHRHTTPEEIFRIALQGDIPGLSSLVQRHIRERGIEQLRMSMTFGADGSVTFGLANRTVHVSPEQMQRAVAIASAANAGNSASTALGNGGAIASGAAGAPAPKFSIFAPEHTMGRWDAEFKGVMNGDGAQLNARLVAHIVNRLSPAARKAAEEEEQKQKAEEEALAKEKAEQDEARKQEAAEALLAASRTNLPESRASPPPPAVVFAATESGSAAAPAAAPTEDVEMTSPVFQPASTLPVVVAEAESSTTTPVIPQQTQVEATQPRADDEASMRSVQVGARQSAGETAPAPEPAQANAAESSTSAATAAAAEPAPSTADRTIIQIHGRDVDITDTGIDLEFLQALPEDMRADVVEQYLREHGVLSSPDLDASDDEGAADGFNDEFLAALPAHLRREILAQQAHELGGRRSAAPPAPPAQPAQAARETAPAITATTAPAAPTAVTTSTAPAGAVAPGTVPLAVIPLSGVPGFSALSGRPMVDDVIRQQIGNITSSITDLLQSLPPGESNWDAAIATVNSSLNERLPGPLGATVRRILNQSAAAAKRARDPLRKEREVIQLLDKNGIACLVRLLFVPDFFRKDHLYNIFNNLCQNSTTRSDLLNLLISVVQDGSGDLPAVDRSFQQMSLKAPAPGATPGGPAHAAVAFQTPKNTPRGRVTAATETPLPPSSAAMTQVASPLLAQLPAENIPAFVTGRCLDALDEIVRRDTQTIDYFLSEHEQPVGLKKTVGSAKGKGKGKEKEKDKTIPQTKFPIVILLGLLERPVLLNTAGLLDAYTALLVKITKPLSSLKAKDAAALKKDQEQAQAQASQSQENGAAATASVSVQTAAGQPESASTDAAPAVLATPRPAAATSTGFLEGLFTPVAPLNTLVDPPRSDTPTRTPVIPAPVLRLIANCLTGKECTRTSFHNAIQVMQNLTNLPEGKDVILAELGTRAQALGAVVHEELAALFAATQAEEAPAADSVLLDKFAPSWASQAQLLRLLKAIEWLYTKKYDYAEFSPDELSPEQKVVGEVFNSFGFDPIWRQLGDCLTAIEQKGNKDDGATLLLPLIEALMIICRYRSRSGRSPSAPAASVPPTPAAGAVPQQIDWSSADLFTVFTTAHRKFLNAIVRNTPSLLSGSFSLLIRNPRVLEFDNKRNWFMQTLKKQRDVHSPSLHLNVRRQYVFEDSFQTLQRRSGDEIKYGKLHVKFVHEDGVDAGGVTREWYSVLSKQIFDPNFVLFEPCAADAQTYQPNKHSSVNSEHLAYYKFVGRIIGKAVYDGRLLDAYFSRAFYKQILGKTVDMRDLESVDPEYHKSLQWILENPVEGVVDLEFAVEDEEFGAKKIVPLKEGGEKITVTDQNKHEYVQLVVSYRLENSIKDQMKAFLTGFFDIIPKQLIQIFEPDQLELLISGLTTIDVDELKNSTQMAGWKPTDPEIGWFWRALRSFSQEERARFLMFVTSSSRVPLGGFTQLQGASGIQPFQIQKLYAPNGSLPQAATCFNQLLLPKYDSYEHLREKLVFAVTETSGFGKA